MPQLVRRKMSRSDIEQIKDNYTIIHYVRSVGAIDQRWSDFLDWSHINNVYYSIAHWGVDVYFNPDTDNILMTEFILKWT